LGSLLEAKGGGLMAEKNDPDVFVAIKRYGNPNGIQRPYLRPERAKGKSKGGRWLCERCLQYRRGSKHEHARVCAPGKAGKS
jgi:hypothetical protein